MNNAITAELTMVGKDWGMLEGKAGNLRLHLWRLSITESCVKLVSIGGNRISEHASVDAAIRWAKARMAKRY